MNDIIKLLDKYLLLLTELIEVERKVTDLLKRYEEN